MLQSWGSQAQGDTRVDDPHPRVKDALIEHKGFTGGGGTCSWIGMPSEMSIATCSIFITGNNLTKGELRLITFSPEK